MSTGIHIVLVTYALDVTPLVDSLWTSDVTLHLYTHSKLPLVVNACNYIQEKYPHVHWNNYGVNRGLARSWNAGMSAAQHDDAEVIFIMNDDIRTSKADMYTLAEAALRNPDFGVIEGMCWDDAEQKRQPGAWSLAAVNKIALDRVGYFDQNFFPIHFEDSDYSRRCQLAGVKWLCVQNTDIYHAAHGTINAAPGLAAQNRETFAANRVYYMEKWRGEPGLETFCVPFNDDKFDLKISADQVNDPYPGYGRTDCDIVKL